ncbi:MAG TPA: Ig-like domain-containing protein [Candidatus Saccharimonadia bacterium]|jgi:hypothetical protein|nr:Ig-like domain-containing protein [Candidatus Saccharimonadia bacterium]
MSVTVGHPSDITISNVAVGDVGQTQATITWDTDVASDSQVAYGLDGAYGSQSALDSALVTSHSVTVSGLVANTAYHFAVTSATPADGGTATSGDNTFLTDAPVPPAPPPVTGGGGTTSDGGVTKVLPGHTPRGTVAIKTAPTETTPPTVALVTSLAKPFSQEPAISGLAHDDVAVARVDYSLDGGRSWVVVPNPPGLGGKSVSFSFTPPRLDDGNYSLVVRAADTSGNVAQTEPVALVIDRQPPAVGAALVSFGPQVESVDAAGQLESVAGLDQTISLNAVGGPVSIMVEAAKAGSAQPSHSFALRQDPASGLWTGVLAFDQAGTYQLRANAVDGAGNRVVRELAAVAVRGAGVVAADTSKASIGAAKLTVYYRQAATGAWLVWDGPAYGEVNPLRTRGDGSFSLVLPAGTYYLKAEAEGYKTEVTREFTLDATTPVTPRLALTKRTVWRIGNWSWMLPGLALAPASVNVAPRTATATASLVGKPLPAFAVAGTGGTLLTPVNLRGKPAVITILSSWAPVSAEQLPALADLRGKGSVNVVPLYVGERVGRVTATLARGGYNLTAYTDDTAALIPELPQPNLPTHIFVSSAGIVTGTYTGVLTPAGLQARIK